MTVKSRYENRLETKAWAAHAAALDLAAHLAIREPEHAAVAVEFAAWLEARLGQHDDLPPDDAPAVPRF